MLHVPIRAESAPIEATARSLMVPRSCSGIEVLNGRELDTCPPVSVTDMLPVSAVPVRPGLN